MKKVLFIVFLLCTLVLTACRQPEQVAELTQPTETTAPESLPVETTVPQETQAPTTVPEETQAPTTVPEETQAPTSVPEETQVPTTVPEETVSDEPIISPLQPGYYVVSSVGIDGSVSLYGTLDPENGYLLLNEDGTGTMLFDGVEADLTWTEDSLVWDSRELVGMCASYYDPELDLVDTMLVLYFMDTPTSVVFRVCPAPET